MLKLIKKDRLTRDWVETKYLDLTNIELFNVQLTRDEGISDVCLVACSVKWNPNKSKWEPLEFKGEVTEQYNLREEFIKNKTLVNGILGINKEGTSELICYPKNLPEEEYIYELYIMNNEGKTIDVIR